MKKHVGLFSRGSFTPRLRWQPAERDDYVRTACGTDEELRRRVLSLLGHDDFRFVESTQRCGQTVAAPRIGPYEVLSKLGAGVWATSTWFGTRDSIGA